MEKEKEARVEVKVNFLSIDRGTGAPIVVLKEKEGDSNRILLIWIGESEWQRLSRCILRKCNSRDR